MPKNRVHKARKLAREFRLPDDDESIRRLSKKLIEIEAYRARLDIPRGKAGAVDEAVEKAIALSCDPFGAMENACHAPKPGEYAYHWPPLVRNLKFQVARMAHANKPEGHQTAHEQYLCYAGLFDHLHRGNCCRDGHALKITTAWFEKCLDDPEQILRWLDKRGVECDCGLLARRGDMFSRLVQKGLVKHRDAHYSHLQHNRNISTFAGVKGAMDPSDASVEGLFSTVVFGPSGGSCDTDGNDAATLGNPVRQSNPATNAGHGRSLRGASTLRRQEERAANRKARHVKKCKLCFNDFQSSKSNAEYCPPPKGCRQKAAYQRKTAEQRKREKVDR